MPQRSDVVYRSALADRLAQQSLTPQRQPIQSTGEGLANMGTMLAQALGAKNIRAGVDEDNAARAQALAKALSGGDPAKEAQLQSVASTPEGIQALQGAYAKSLMPEKSPTSVQEFKFAQQSGFKGSYNDFLASRQSGGQETFGNTPIWGTDAQGNPVLMQPSNRGGVKQVELPAGVKPQRGGVTKVDVGDKIAIMDANGNFIAFQPKGIAPQQTIDEKGNRIIVAPGVPGGAATAPGGAVPPAGVPQQPAAPAAQPSAAPAAPAAIQPVGGPSVSQIPPPKAMMTKAQSALGGFERQTKVVTSSVDKALALVSPWSTGYGAFLADMPETDAGKLRNELDTIKANIGFDKLQQMRDNSPTGGALGQVSELENKLLQAVNGALDPKQSVQLVANLKNIKELYGQVMEERRGAFQKDYGSLVPSENMPAPAAEAAPAPPEAPSIPPSAAEHLKKNPRLRDAFDQKYGAGAAASVLGK